MRSRASEAGRAWPYLLLAVVLVVAGGGVAAYSLGYLDRWVCEDGTCAAREPEAAAVPETPEAPVLRPALTAASGSAGLDAAAVQRAVGPLLSRKALGPHVGFAASDLTTGEQVWSSGTGTFVPASTLKLFTSMAAMTAIGSEHRFRTTVVRDTTDSPTPTATAPTTTAPATPAAGAPTRVVLVGGGDPYLTATSDEEARAAYPQQVSLAQLARQTAKTLRADGIGSVSLGYDASLFTGPAVSPQWEPGYISSFVTTPVSALWVDQGTDGWKRSATPDKQAAQLFARQLRARGITVEAITPATKPASSEELAAVSSGTVAQIVQSVIEHSDNQAAEVLLRHVALAEGQPASFTGGVAAVEKILTGLGVPWEGNRIYDGSGLARSNHVTLASMLSVVSTAADLFDRYPVAGFTGSLATRFTAPGTAAGLGAVRAKTGTLTGVHGLAGTTITADGTPVGFVVLTDRVPVPKTGDARDLLARIAARLTACACGTG
ncbi:D-alanyl-D-alanine carboxypeptidase/D-alanyl-D-alanine-endopeptidase [Mumia zhuanghuii]|uniref:D-alanyl-D-alanine carboxypeptidase/D-alanyl-D-alanine-endopeptidase n=2 Tax=Mumia TaxID=1546255 RepID=A0A5Q6S204_9ACTN|nr:MULTISPECIES: D-alanyl-D-alanine carboxypeptidase/D-alanyl-D-alanine-endopeptidase [Mumia]KAA1418033.1 D-alanyl-D-alanine carboxypeptidase/D-alanyl-D-alanine-endopeptidase [Mumia zhuanghuii]KAA1424412.1 D-alanyl-D-alanine carboxypeptidase/D-alanyl-D-alanine-endopeptidase [Mumia zhuanghuii]